MSSSGNGTSRDRFGVACTEDPSLGYALFYAEAALPPDSEKLPDLISKSIARWVDENRGRTVTTTLPIVQNGNTIAVHLWYKDR